jgi:hypothetical protein
MRNKNISNQKFNRLTAIERVGTHGVGSRHKQVATWKCLCDCGTECVVRRDQLVSGHTKSCGCLQKEKAAITGKSQAKPIVAAFNALILSYKKGAKNRKLSWNLSDDLAANIFKERCYYCDAGPKSEYKTRTTSYSYNGIDRKDPNIGYEPDNCVPCCSDCNYAKSDKTVSEFLDMIENIYKNMWRY